MSESFIEPDSLNTIFQNLSAVVDDDGATKFLNSEISSFNFDGFIPLETDTIDVSELRSGMQFILIGDPTNSIRTALKIEFDDPEMTASPTNDYIISYLGPNGDIQTVTYDASDQVEVYFEDWENKVLGSTGWTITQAGNAIFSNVAVRGDIEATTLDVGGVNGIVYDGDTVTIGASVVINAPVEFGGGDLSASYATYSFLTASYADIADLQIAGRTIINGGNITTGVLNANLVNISSGSASSNRGIKITASGLFAYNSSGVQTFSLNASTGAVTIGSNDGSSLITGGQVNANVTSISGGAITTGTISANRIDVDNLVAKNLRTATSGKRIEINSIDINTIKFYSGIFPEYEPGYINVDKTGDSTFGYRGQVVIAPPKPDSFSPDTRIIMLSDFDGTGSIAAAGGERIIIRCPTIEIEGNVSISSGSNFIFNNTKFYSNPTGPNNYEYSQVQVSTANPGTTVAVNGTIWIVV